MIIKELRELIEDSDFDADTMPYLNNKRLVDYALNRDVDIFLDEITITRPERKVARVNLTGGNGTIDFSEEVARFEDRVISVGFTLSSCSKKQSLKVVDDINKDIFSNKMMDIKIGKNEIFYYQGSCDNGIAVAHEDRGILRCELEFIVYPMAILSLADNDLWDNIIIEDYYFNIYTYILPSKSAIDNKFIHLPENNKAAELRVNSSAKVNLEYLTANGVNKSIALTIGWNYIDLRETRGIFPFSLKNDTANQARVSFSFQQEVLRDV